jgi:hypothetical protein
MIGIPRRYDGSFGFTADYARREFVSVLEKGDNGANLNAGATPDAYRMIDYDLMRVHGD